MRCPKFFIPVCLLLLLSGCNPDDDNNNDNNNDDNAEFTENFGSEVQRDFIGQVVDINGEPIQNATVKIGSSTKQTDVNGIFVINSAPVYEQFAYIAAKKSGFIDGSRSIVPTAGKNNVKIMMIPATAIASVASGQPSEVTLPSGTKVMFDGAFSDESGTAYTGNVSVAMYHLQASNPEVSRLMPGMLYAETENGDEASLQTFGMLNVELRGNNGQKLQIANGHEAEISMKIDDSQTASAPSSIPLWHFDEAFGYWKEDGVATKQGGFYVGEVSHFSWWNAYTYSQSVALTVNVKDESGNPISNARVGLNTNPLLPSMIAYTDDNGRVSSYAPASMPLTVEIYDICQNQIYTSAVGSITTDSILPDIIIAGSSTFSSHVEGVLYNCGGTVVENGYVTLKYEDVTLFSPVNNGNFSFSLLACNSNNTFILEGVDYETQQLSGDINFTLTGASTNVGSLLSCSAIDEFITYQIDNNPLELFLNNVTPGSASNSNGNFNFSFPNYSVGTHSSGLGEAISGPGFNAIYTPTSNDHLTYTISSFPTLGTIGYVDIFITGTFTQDNVQHTITCTIHALQF